MSHRTQNSLNPFAQKTHPAYFPMALTTFLLSDARAVEFRGVPVRGATVFASGGYVLFRFMYAIF